MTFSWAASGALWLTGHPDGPALAPDAAVVPALEDAAAEMRALAPGLVVPSVAEILTGRAALLGLERRGRTSANGTCRLFPTADGWAALNLARPSDVELLPALFERSVDGDPWDAAASALLHLDGGELVGRAALLGVPAAVLPTQPHPRPAPGPFRLHPRGDAGPDRRLTDLLVVDLSALWAGPLCAQLLGRTGMRVVKVEDPRRPDGARSGNARFFDWLHHGHASVGLDFSSTADREALAHLVARADVVIESSRPRALAQLGIDAEAVVARRPGTTWVSITGYGRAEPRVAFGDDAAVAAGLVAYDADGAPVFCADAIADPISGLYAALGSLTSISSGGGHLVEIAMADAVATVVARRRPLSDPLDDVDVDVAQPAVPAATAAAPALGADTRTVLRC